MNLTCEIRNFGSCHSPADFWAGSRAYPHSLPHLSALTSAHSHTCCCTNIDGRMTMQKLFTSLKCVFLVIFSQSWKSNWQIFLSSIESLYISCLKHTSIFLQYVTMYENENNSHFTANSCVTVSHYLWRQQPTSEFWWIIDAVPAMTFRKIQRLRLLPEPKALFCYLRQFCHIKFTWVNFISEESQRTNSYQN